MALDPELRTVLIAEFRELLHEYDQLFRRGEDFRRYEISADDLDWLLLSVEQNGIDTEQYNVEVLVSAVVAFRLLHSDLKDEPFGGFVFPR